MTDGLDAAIREWLGPVPTVDQWHEWMHRTHSALTAVLDLHAAPDRALPGEIHCGELIDWVQGGCPTLRVIAEKLGVEVDDGRASV